MKKLLSSFAIAAVLLASTGAEAFYVGLAGGSAKTKIDGDSVDPAFSYTVSAGLAFPIPLFPIRAEVEFLNLRSSEDLGSVRTYGFAANGYVDLPLLPIIHPYLGFGLASMKQSAGGDKSDSKVAPQYMLGLDIGIPLLPLHAGVEYRYIDADFDYSGIESTSKIHAFLLKARYTF
ncbi:MAG: porin family protein [Rickettsiales bacterium]|jgi:opacity protein-like surface antigen|nr:porin family protein [Rickettsiales bacterium]